MSCTILSSKLGGTTGASSLAAIERCASSVSARGAEVRKCAATGSATCRPRRAHWRTVHDPTAPKPCAGPPVHMVCLRPAIVTGKCDGSLRHQIGRASCRERVCKYVSISVVAVTLKKNKKNNYNV